MKTLKKYLQLWNENNFLIFVNLKITSSEGPYNILSEFIL